MNAAHVSHPGGLLIGGGSQWDRIFGVASIAVDRLCPAGMGQGFDILMALGAGQPGMDRADQSFGIHPERFGPAADHAMQPGIGMAGQAYLVIRLAGKDKRERLLLHLS